MQNKTIKAVYMHIPFCKHICAYCDFCKNYYEESIVIKYLDALEKEVKGIYKGEKIRTIYIGGGTPSSLSKKALKNLFKVTDLINIDDDYEFTFECNVDDINETFLETLKENKVNRISVGVETFNNKFATFLGRKINSKLIIKNINLCKKYFDNINADLMYALKDETLDDLQKDLDLFIKLDVSHISTYALQIEEHTSLKNKKVTELDDDLQSKMYETIINTLKKHGYSHYEISNFAKNGYASKHNLTYWNNEEYYGFGLSSSFFVNRKRGENTRSIFNYINGDMLLDSYEVDNKMLIKDEVMLGLRKTDGINLTQFKAKFDKCFEDVFKYDELVKKGFLKLKNNHLFISKKKLFVSNSIILELLETYK